ncbi:MAG TPA: PfkB family carbohydrate kinase [Acidobacteriota bacterium]|nr:PfkB family carbohydrate kinase [Acidobacteriota bacterium]
MPEILAVGSVAYDSVETPFGKVERALGGSATYFSVSASFFTKVFLVGCVGKDFEKEHIEMLESKDIDLEGLQVVEGETFFWAGKYGYDLNEAHTLDTQLNVFADFHPEIPEAYRDAQYVFLGNIDPVLQREVLSQVRNPKLVACDTMNYWINDHLDSLRQTIAQIDVLLINDAETRQLANESNIVRAARRILDWGPHTLVIKRGEYGVLMFRRDSQARDQDNGVSAFAVPGYPLEEIFDPTGAGDSFAGGFMGYLAGSDRADTAALRQAIIFGSVMASFNVERFSLERLKELTFTEVGLRYKEFRRLTHFEDVD